MTGHNLYEWLLILSTFATAEKIHSDVIPVWMKIVDCCSDGSVLVGSVRDYTKHTKDV